LNDYRPDKIGSTGIAEPKYVKAVTGKDFSFLDGINLGRKLWNLDQAIWTLQGRHRDMVHFVENLYEKQPLFTVDDNIPNVHMPGKKDGKWGLYGYSRRTLNKDKFDEFKTRFYRLQGWDESSGYPTRKTLESLDLGYVADELKSNNKLGKG
jgi:aldehyde:ferredoxin oxidoreductase